MNNGLTSALLFVLLAVLVLAAGVGIYSSYQAARNDISAIGHRYGEIFWRVGNAQHRVETSRIQTIHFLEPNSQTSGEDVVRELDYLYMELTDVAAMADFATSADERALTAIAEFLAVLERHFEVIDQVGLEHDRARVILQRLQAFSERYSQIRISLASDHSEISRRFNAGFWSVTRLFLVASGGVILILGVVGVLVWQVHRKGEEARAVERLARASRLQMAGALVQGFAHGINSTIAAIRGSAKRLEGHGITRECPDLQTIHAGLDRLGVLSRDLQDFAEDGGDVEGLDLATHTRLILAGLDDDVDIDAPQAIEALANRQAIEVVLEELIKNAASVQPPGVPIRVSVEEHRTHVALTVTDCGPGVPSALGERIFEPFFTTRSDAHSGLGLSRIRAIMELLEGSLTFRNLAQGCAFTARFRRPIQSAV